jgi:hypothetical protein
MTRQDKPSQDKTRNGWCKKGVHLSPVGGAVVASTGKDMHRNPALKCINASMHQPFRTDYD